MDKCHDKWHTEEILTIRKIINWLLHHRAFCNNTVYFWWWSYNIFRFVLNLKRLYTSLLCKMLTFVQLSRESKLTQEGWIFSVLKNEKGISITLLVNWSHCLQWKIIINSNSSENEVEWCIFKGVKACIAAWEKSHHKQILSFLK